MNTLKWIPFDVLQPNCDLIEHDFLVTDGNVIIRAWTDHDTWYCDAHEDQMTHWMSFKQIPLPNGQIRHDTKNKIIHGQ